MKKLVLTWGALAALALPALALAGGSTVSGYGGEAGSVQGAVQKSGTLPFTGLSLTIVLVVGVALVALGYLLRRGGRTSA